MTFSSQNLVYVYYHALNNRHRMGRLLLKNRRLFFEYDGEFTKLELELSPFKLPLKSGVIPSDDRVFEGLFGVFNDSVPDGWARLLLDRIEYAYHLMAREAGLYVPEAKLFPSKNGPGFFGVKRFDRKESQPVHMHTIAGLLHADHREPSLDYESIMKATMHLTQNIRECEAQFRNSVFNVLSHNRDDHSKNFSFLMDEQGVWRVSPAYDLTFSSGPFGEHSTMVMGEGRNPRIEHLLKLANLVGIKKDKALEIIDQVHIGIAKWKICADKAGVSKRQVKKIGDAFKKVFSL